MNMQNQQFTQQVIGNYICNYGIIPSTDNDYDIFDFFKISDTKYGLYILDVAGSGQESKLAAQQTDKIISDLANSEQKELFAENPEELIKKVNDKIYNLKLGKHLTLFYGVLDLENNQFNYITAGHYPNPILLNYDGYPQFLSGKGYPLGIMPNPTFERNSIRPSINETIVICSNGIIKQYMPESNMDSKSNYLLKIIYNSKAKIDSLLDQLNTSVESEIIIDDIIIATITRNT